MADESGSLRVGQALKSILPEGTASYLDNETADAQDETLAWLDPPVWPTDLFAACAHLVHGSGLLTYFEPDPDYESDSKDKSVRFTLSVMQRLECVQTGAAWSEVAEVPAIVYRLWKKLISAWDLKLRASTYAQLNRKRNAPIWWSAVLQLLIIADEASVGLGAPPRPDRPNRWLVDVFQQIYAQPYRVHNRLASGAYRANRQPMTFRNI